jgi:hypothetical protein
MIMQVDACFKKEQIGTLLFGWGHWKGGWGGGPSGLSSSKIIRAYPKSFLAPPALDFNFIRILRIQGTRNTVGCMNTKSAPYIK